ncbi:MAG TPA: metal-dependent hydrolase [Povalibacter sp.]|uniref:metal-dependent hydrolase n=1 Tax=Povalibacter sp. TaxID=1962978 RepID=UPI002C0C94FF|nr:metal-dependent hydrolase [Povalibacter sp.]HMN45472.1 metal-dependent hydrolase [Povalibacter sp.]
MDNLTHTLAGVLVGETLARTTSPSPSGLSQPQRRNLLVTLMAVGSNVPDLDFLSSAISGDKLEYLLEHRGHTHTVIGAFLAAALLYLVCEAWCRWRHWPLMTRDRWHVAAAALLALLLHITMDFANNYGVHPFWPVDNRWLYGDTIFIWEPLLWTAAAPLIFILRTTLARVLVGALLAAALAACFGSGLVPIGFAVLATGLALAMLGIARRTKPVTALLAGIALWLSITATFALSRNAAETQVRRFVSEALPQMTVLDYVLTPFPANPVCWDVMLPMTDADRYVIRRGTWSLWPQVLPAARCPGHELLSNVTAPMTRVVGNDSPAVIWHGEVVMRRTELPALAVRDCDAAALMHFARVPWALRRENTWIVGDLRYDREPALGFAEIELKKDAAHCSSPLPPWLPPRGDLLGE